jgi:hypothetical protein
MAFFMFSPIPRRGGEFLQHGNQGSGAAWRCADNTSEILKREAATLIATNATKNIKTSSGD